VQLERVGFGQSAAELVQNPLKVAHKSELTGRFGSLELVLVVVARVAHSFARKELQSVLVSPRNKKTAHDFSLFF
jgi:hypothetical protein